MSEGTNVRKSFGIATGVVTTPDGMKEVAAETRTDADFVAGEQPKAELPPPAPALELEAVVTPPTPEPAPIAAVPVDAPTPEPLPSFKGLYCSTCRETLTDDHIVVQPLDFFRNEDGSVSPYASSCSLFCKWCMKYLGMYDAQTKLQRP